MRLQMAGRGDGRGDAGEGQHRRNSRPYQTARGTPRLRLRLPKSHTRHLYVRMRHRPWVASVRRGGVWRMHAVECAIVREQRQVSHPGEATGKV